MKNEYYNTIYSTCRDSTVLRSLLMYLCMNTGEYWAFWVADL